MHQSWSAFVLFIVFGFVKSKSLTNKAPMVQQEEVMDPYVVGNVLFIVIGFLNTKPLKHKAPPVFEDVQKITATYETRDLPSPESSPVIENGRKEYNCSIIPGIGSVCDEYMPQKIFNGPQPQQQQPEPPRVPERPHLPQAPQEPIGFPPSSVLIGDLGSTAITSLIIGG